MSLNKTVADYLATTERTVMQPMNPFSATSLPALVTTALLMGGTPTTMTADPSINAPMTVDNQTPPMQIPEEAWRDKQLHADCQNTDRSKFDALAADAIAEFRAGNSTKLKMRPPYLTGRHPTGKAADIETQPHRNHWLANSQCRPGTKAQTGNPDFLSRPGAA